MPYVKKIQLVTQTYTEGPRHQRIPEDVKPYRSVFATIESVGQKEFFQANAEGREPSGKATIWAFEYHGEKIMVLENARYSIYRTYMIPGTKKIELYFAMQLAPSTFPEVTP